VALVFRRALANELVAAEGLTAADPLGPPNRELLPKGIAVLLGLIVLFFCGAPIAPVALGAGAVLMLGRVRSERLYAQVDWSLLVMFAGLFVVVHGFEERVLARWDLQRFAATPHTPVAALTVAAAALSNLVSNVPAVLLLKSAVSSLAPAAHEKGWLTLAMASTLSGNLTPIASVANLIVVESARREGVEVSLWDYCRVGVPVTAVTLMVGAAWLTWLR
jgi:Na+/H+ antiporter NhaD/arsenite permease-like protein